MIIYTLTKIKVFNLSEPVGFLQIQAAPSRLAVELLNSPYSAQMPDGAVLNNLPANEGDAKDLGLIPG